jgi:hypothetical protein
VGAGAESADIEYPPVFDVNEMFGKHRHPFASQAYKEFVRDQRTRPIPGTPPLCCPSLCSTSVRARARAARTSAASRQRGT